MDDDFIVFSNKTKDKPVRKDLRVFVSNYIGILLCLGRDNRR